MSGETLTYHPVSSQLKTELRANCLTALLHPYCTTPCNIRRAAAVDCDFCVRTPTFTATAVRWRFAMRFRKDRLPPPRTFYEKEFRYLRRSGRNQVITFCCFHPDKRHPNLSLNLVTGAFHCWACGASGGDVVDFLQFAITSTLRTRPSNCPAGIILAPSPPPRCRHWTRRGRSANSKRKPPARNESPPALACTALKPITP